MRQFILDMLSDLEVEEAIVEHGCKREKDGSIRANPDYDIIG